MTFRNLVLCRVPVLRIDLRLPPAIQQPDALYIVDSNPGNDRNRSTGDGCQNRLLSQEKVKDYRRRRDDVANNDEPCGK
jgi:hypothetical protein